MLKSSLQDYYPAESLKDSTNDNYIVGEAKLQVMNSNDDNFQIISEIVERICKKLSEHVEPFDDEITTQKHENISVRRSNRIRRAVVRKDEIVIPCSNKRGNKNKRKSEIFNLKTETNYQITSKNNQKKEKCNKSKKVGKLNKKVNHPTKQNEMISLEKKNEGSQDMTFDNMDKETSLAQPQTLASTCAKILHCVSNAETNSSYKYCAMHKMNDDQSSETSEKSLENCNIKPVKVKSRWWRSSELEAVMNSEMINLESVSATESKIKPIDIEVPFSSTSKTNPMHSEDMFATSIQKNECLLNSFENIIKSEDFAENNENKKVIVDKTSEVSNLPIYEHIEENIYRFNRRKCKSKKQVRRMVCDCNLTKEELDYGVIGCKEECLNRLLMIECGSRCPIGEACSNKKFQKKEYAKVEIFKTEKKGWGLRTLEDISAGDFLMEFVGEVLNHKEYRQRVRLYAKEKNVHSYFMALKTDEILDATGKGNFSRFINHSCNPNCETQKWTVNGELRVGVFAKQIIYANEELTLDYQFQRYGREAQKCYCGSENCSGFIGGAKLISIDAYSGNNRTFSRNKKKGAEDKKRDLEDMILEEEIEKLNISGLRNRDDTLKLARLMVRADDSTTRHQLLDIIQKTEEQACLRLFLDYHGLPLLWSWMADVVDFELKTKILLVLSLLPITNKTMLLDSKVISIVEKWQAECSLNSCSKSEDASKKPIHNDEFTESTSRKLRLTELSDSETDSASSHAVVETFNEGDSETFIRTEKVKEDSTDKVLEDSDNSFKQNISNLASELLSSWKNLKEVFRIPRLEQLKRKEDEMEVDNNAQKDLPSQQSQSVKKASSAYNNVSIKCGDQIQVVISGKNVLSDHHKGYDYEQSEMKLDDYSRRFNQSRSPSVLVKPRQTFKLFKPYYASHLKLVEKENKEDVSPDDLSSTPPMMSHNYPFNYLEPHQSLTGSHPEQQPPLFSFPPPINPPPPILEGPSLVYPPQVMYPQTQLPYVNPSPSVLPPPSTIASHPPPIQQPSLNSGIPPVIANQAPPQNTPNYLLPPNVPPPSALPGTSHFVPNPVTPVPNYPPPAKGVYTNQSQPLYFLPQQPNLPNNPPASSFLENSLPVHQSSSTFPLQQSLVKEEEPKPIKLPKNWRTATDEEGNVYYYHSVTRQTQWDPPSEDEEDNSSTSAEETESSDTPTYDEPKFISLKLNQKKNKKRKPTKAAADTSVAPVRPEIAKKIKELFRTKISSFIVHCLNAYRKPTCSVGRITSNDDFKYLARKLTHYTMTKELKQCRNVEDLDCNETVQHKAKDFIKKYMAKYGVQYNRKERTSPT